MCYSSGLCMIPLRECLIGGKRGLGGWRGQLISSRGNWTELAVLACSTGVTNRLISRQDTQMSDYGCVCGVTLGPQEKVYKC